MTYKIAVSGAAAGECTENAKDLAIALGAAIADQGAVLVTGATSGVNYFSSKGGKKKKSEKVRD